MTDNKVGEYYFAINDTTPAIIGAKTHGTQAAWPRMGQHRATQMVEVEL